MPYIHCLNFIQMMGAALTPQILKPFLAANVGMSLNTTKNDSFILSRSKDEYGPNSLEYLNITHGTEVFNKTLINGVKTKVQFSYLITGLVLASGAFLHTIMICQSICRGKQGKDIDNEIAKNPDDSNSKGRNATCKVHCFLFIAVCFVLGFLYGGLEEIFGGFLVTFSVNELYWSNESARDLSTLYWISIATTRLIAVFLSRKISAKVLIGLSICLVNLSLLAMAFTVVHFSLAISIGTVLFGLGLGSLFTNVINLCRNTLDSLSSGFLTSIMFVSLHTSKLSTPLLIGYLFENVDYMWFLYLSVVYAGAMFMTYLILLTLVKQSRSD